MALDAAGVSELFALLNCDEPLLVVALLENHLQEAESVVAVVLAVFATARFIVARLVDSSRSTQRSFGRFGP